MDYRIERIDTAEGALREVTRFLRETFPRNGKFTFEYVKWQYAGNPLGPMVGFNAWDGDRIVSHFAGLPIEMNLFGTVRRGLLCINVGTNERHRGRGLFTAVGESTVRCAADEGFEFMIAVPNANSTHGFLRHFGFYLVSPLTVKIGFCHRIYPDRDYDCYKTWDEAQWRWRLGNPVGRYSWRGDKSVSDSNVGAAAPGIVSTPVSFFARTLSAARLPQSAVRTLPRHVGLRPVNLYVGLGADTAKGCWFDIPSFIKRPPFNLVFRDLTGGGIPVIGKEDIFIQLIDFDTI